MKPIKIKIYLTPTCPYCKQVKEFLTDKGVDYVDVDVSNDSVAAQEMIKKSGQMGVPVIDVGGIIIIGFDKNRLSKLLGL